jgi:hypothetical protein
MIKGIKKMKKKKVLLIMILTSLIACKTTAQTLQETEGTVVPLVQYLDFKEDETISFPNNPYFKDVDNDLSKYIGTWIGTNNDNTYELVINKFKNQYSSISIDELELRYKIINSLGITVATTLDLPRFSPYNVLGEFLSRDKSYYSLYYIGFEGKCGQNGYMSLRVTNSTANILYLKYTVHGEQAATGCASTAPQIFPVTQDLVLTKQ